MREKIEWQHVNGKTDDELIACVEKILTIKFPDDYLKYVKKYPNGSPVPNFFRTKKDTFVFGNGGTFEYFFDFNPDSKSYILKQYYVLNIHSGGDNQVPDGVIPFASASHNHDFLCFDYRKGFPPTIVFLDLEKHWNFVFKDDFGESEIKEDDYLINICDSFTELLDMLEEEPKDG